MIFDLFSTVKAKSGQRCTAQLFDQAISDPKLVALCQRIADETDKQRRQDLKKQLPVVTYHASFDGKSRTNANAIPSGLCAVDIDDIELPYKVFSEQVLPHKRELDIRLAHLTPSQHGLRVVFVCQANRTTIAENMAWFESVTGLQCDPACKDLARASYLVPESYLYYRDNSMFEESGERKDDSGKMREATQSPEGDASGRQLSSLTPSKSFGFNEVNASHFDSPLSTNIQTQFKGLKLTDIANEWLKANGGMPAEGERNNVLHRMAFSLRYITEFRPEPIFQAIPHCGLPDSEVMALCQSACNAPRSVQMPYDLQQILNGKWKTESEKMREATQESEDFVHRLPQKLPIGLADSIYGVPDKMKMPIICGVMTLASAYATDVKVEYCDGLRQRLNLMAIVFGSQASGKSSVKNVMEIWLKPMREADAEAREKEEAYKDLKKSRKANEKLPEEPHQPILNIPITVSNSVLLKRMKNAKGKHIFSFGEELDTMRKTNGSGAWSDKYDVYRMGFDNGVWGQDYNSDQAVSGQVEVAYNWCMLGTPGSVKRIFKADSIENGMSGRVLFSMMPNNLFEFMPKYKARDPQLDANILEAVHILSNSTGYVDTPHLRNAIEKWCNDKAIDAMLSNDTALDMYRRRAAVIGFRCGVVYHLLQAGGDLAKIGKESRDCIRFALLMADYTLKYQLCLFREAMKESIEASVGARVTKRVTLFDKLPDEFTTANIKELDSELSAGAIKQTVYVWNRQKMLVPLGRGHWRKTHCSEKV